MDTLSFSSSYHRQQTKTNLLPPKRRNAVTSLFRSRSGRSFTSSCHRRQIETNRLPPQRRSAITNAYHFHPRCTFVPPSRGFISRIVLSTQSGIIYFRCHCLQALPLRCLNVGMDISQVDLSSQGGTLDSRDRKLTASHAGEY